MLGAIFGDIVGSPWESQNMMGDIAPQKSTDFPLFLPGSRFTDDTVLTVAIADALLRGLPFAPVLHEWGRRYPHSGYGGSFWDWLQSPNPQPYGSWGNGSAMRVSPAGWYLPTSAKLPEVMELAKRTALPTHDHVEGIYGAQAVAMAIFLARQGEGADEIRLVLRSFFPEYDLSRTVDEVRPGYNFDVSCMGSVPEAILCALEARSTEEAVRLAVSLGGDADTQACIAGSIAEARFGFPEEHFAEVMDRLPGPMIDVVDAFRARYNT